MHLAELFKTRQTTFSFEFFPPKTAAAAEELFSTISELQPLRPSFVSVTYGAGGSTRQITQDLVLRLKRESSLTVLPHLTCIGHTEAEIYDILEAYAAAGIENILALGGDPPRTTAGYDRSRDAFTHACELVRFLREFRLRTGGQPLVDPRGFGIAVAGYPEGHPATPNRLREIEYLKRKVDEGAHAIITQLFFDNRDFYDFRDRCEMSGIKVPIIAGIMPVTSAAGMERMAELAAGTRYPAPLLRAIQRATSGYPDQNTPEARQAIRSVGIHWATEQCRDLLDHQVRGLHFYTLNKSSATRQIYASLGVPHSMALA
jgi:methylenetetrahydrofolate reductase (NADPH)